MTLNRGKPLERRTPLRAKSRLDRGSGTLKRTRLNPVSDKRRDENEAWEECKRAVDRRDRGVCQASQYARREGYACSHCGYAPANRAGWCDLGCGRDYNAMIPMDVPVCAGPMHPHHRWPTGEGGPRLTVDGVLTCCAAHHRWAHSTNRVLATALRLITRGNEHG